MADNSNEKKDFDNSGNSVHRLCCGALSILGGIVLLIMVVLFMGKSSTIEELEKDLDVIGNATAAVCTFSNQPGTAVKQRKEYDSDGTNKVVMQQYDVVSCSVTVHYETDGSDSKRSVDGSVYAGVDMTIKRDVKQWCEELLSQEPWGNLIIQGSWKIHKHDITQQDGFACGKRQIVSSFGCTKTERKTKDCSKKENQVDLDWVDESFTCPDGALKDGGTSACTVDAENQVRLGTVEDQMAQAKKAIEDEESAKTTCLILVIVFGALMGLCCAVCLRAQVKYFQHQSQVKSVDLSQ